ncbi:hypothetical protein [Synechococcus sp. M16CYN]|uniref:hypothetical protein n=1 Tax=Synechococcus sp. M16CYN TaxID=3103139 RepID=UPI0030E3EA89
MGSFWRAAFVTVFCVCAAPTHNPALAGLQTLPLARFCERLESALNRESKADLNSLVAQDVLSDLEPRYESFRVDFPNAKWAVEPAEPLADGRPTLLVHVTGTVTIGSLKYQLKAQKQMAIRLEKGKLSSQEVLSQQSLLRSGKRLLKVTLNIPDVVLAGNRYEIDFIVDEPLGQAMLVGGLINLSDDQQLATFKLHNLHLAPLGGGGLFKSVRAPQRPGSQTWGMMLVHPDGIVTATKHVQILNRLAEKTRT